MINATAHSLLSQKTDFWLNILPISVVPRNKDVCLCVFCFTHTFWRLRKKLHFFLGSSNCYINPSSALEQKIFIFTHLVSKWKIGEGCQIFCPFYCHKEKSSRNLSIVFLHGHSMFISSSFLWRASLLIFTLLCMPYINAFTQFLQKIHLI